MIRSLLLWGMLAGVCGGLLSAGFAHFVGEPAVDEAIAYEESQAAAAGLPAGDEIVSRSVQSGVGLLAAASFYGLALGGVFALVFGFAYGRVGRASPRTTALWLAAGVFAVFFLVPFLKYPATPPAVGDPETIGERTQLYLLMIAISVLAAVASLRVRAWLARHRSPGAATLVGVATYLVVVTAAGLAMPGVNELPAGFPAETLWRFREATVGMQLVLWSTIGLVFAAGVQRLMAQGSPAAKRTRASAKASDASI